MTKKQAEVSVQTRVSRVRSSALSLLVKPRTMFPDLRAPCKVICGAGKPPEGMLSSVLGILLRALTGLWL